jgi:hypothetical protein
LFFFLAQGLDALHNAMVVAGALLLIDLARAVAVG